MSIGFCLLFSIPKKTSDEKHVEDQLNLNFSKTDQKQEQHVKNKMRCCRRFSSHCQRDDNINGTIRSSKQTTAVVEQV